MTRRVVVTGIGMVTPLGPDATTNWDALTNGRSGITRITKFDPSKIRNGSSPLSLVTDSLCGTRLGV